MGDNWKKIKENFQNEPAISKVLYFLTLVVLVLIILVELCGLQLPIDIGTLNMVFWVLIAIFILVEIVYKLKK
ncbi:putative uncharacterized protein [Methanobrevibacter smithii CAG:186]|uniref:Uncharacterized protein n=1 Tax=Methanobrevibacter smithii CAG:186 TaxID=1263088 RepID=R7PTF3_METSM|nr:hypothetical protein [Methanobrevibacter smithii]CDF29203.1 putative uncharacterized protein [Methanobrevibacter smithii CAG:186]